MKYYNVKTNQHADVLPIPTVPFAVKAGVVQGTANAASIAEWQRAQGWRTVKLSQSAGEGWRVDAWMHTDDDGTNCNLIIAHAVDVAKEQADAEAAYDASLMAVKEATAIDAGDSMLARVLVAVINKRLPADKQITKAECVAEARRLLGI
jgi:hypothetical protein